MAAPIGATVSIAPFDMCAGEPVPDEGVYLLSAGGTAYLITSSRPMTRSARPNNYALRALKLGGADQIPEGAQVIAFAFTRRDRRRPR
jgi:hypothetical protein